MKAMYPTHAAYEAEQAAIRARFNTTPANARLRREEALEAAEAATQSAQAAGYNPGDSRTFTPDIRRALQAAQDAGDAGRAVHV